MTVKKLIQAEIDKIPEQELDNLYQWIKKFAEKINRVQNKNIPTTSEKHLDNSYPYDDLNNLAGTWTQEDEIEFSRNTKQFNEIDKQLWQ